MFHKGLSAVRRHVQMALSAGTIIILLLVILFSVRETGTVDAVVGDAKPVAQEVESVALSPVLTYQGRLLNPTTGAPMADGSYTFTFRLYNVESGGTELWTELKDLTVTNGLFSHLLGSSTALPVAIFTGQDLWLGIKVGADAEATPRQRIAPVAYAMYSGNADRLDGQEGAYYRNATNLNAGTVAEARVDAAIARDSEVMGIVKANDGSGSTVDADLLDGQESTAFAGASHNHDAAYVNVTGPESISGSDPNSAVLTIKQNAANTGIDAYTVSTDIGEAAVIGVAGAKGPTLNAVTGVWGTSTSGRGVTGSSSTEDGVLGFSTSGTGVDGQSSSGIGVRAFSSTGTALQVDGNAVFNGNITSPLVPIALGFINTDGTKSVGTPNFTSTWVAASTRYEITITGQSYLYNKFVTVVTPTCAGYSARTSSVSGKLLVFVDNTAGSPAQCNFQFVTYKP